MLGVAVTQGVLGRRTRRTPDPLPPNESLPEVVKDDQVLVRRR
jgi:hypothetical protein